MSKERLVELIADARADYYDYSDKMHENGMSVDQSSEEYIADKILADGWIRLPCKVGDTVWYFSKNPLNLSVQANTIYESKVVRIVTTSLGTSLVIQIHNDYGCTEIPNIIYFGKEVFLIREEAEAKLKEIANANTL